MTRYEHDALGRRLKRTLPGSAGLQPAFEQLRYDAWGDLWQRDDFAGHTTTFAYDELHRLETKTADPEHPSLAYTHAIARVEYDYDDNGAREAARTYAAAGTLLYVEGTPRDELGRIDHKDTGSALLDYDYYANGLLKDIVSSTPSGVNLGYRYDELNRLAFVDDASRGLPVRTTSYAYTANGSLEAMTYANGLRHAYRYDSLNRLRHLDVGQAGGLASPGIAAAVQTYDYRLRASGHRREIVETGTTAATRTVNYAYDELHRLTGETIAGDPLHSGSVGYTLDKVGNRETRTSSVPSVPSVVNVGFNARDQLSTDSYDANGNTSVGQTAGLASAPAAPDVYDFEDRLIVRTRADLSKIYLAYDADGIRIGKTIHDASAQVVASTAYLICTNNLTGYAQVLEERTTDASGTTLKAYAYGSDLVSVATQAPGSSLPAPSSFFLYDGGGSVRALADEAGAITDRYIYDAFGVLIARQGTSDNAYLYRGEHYDADLGLYSLRARFYNPDSGRFWNQDTYEGSNADPASLHKYLYAHANPVTGFDPSGHFTLNDVMLAVWNVGIQAGLAVARVSPAAAAAGKTLATVASYTLSALNLYWFATDQHFREFVVATGGTGVLVADAGKLLELGQGLVKLTRSAVQAAGLLRVGGAPNLQLSNLGGHNAEVTLLGKDGKLLSRWGETSGGQTPEQLAMGFPRGSLASHTEVKAVQRVHLATGETMIIRGTLPPCPSCKGVMRGATANSGVRIEYHYPQPSRADGEELVIEIWENGQKVSGSGS